MINQNNAIHASKNKFFVSKCKKINLILRHKMFTFIFESSAELYLNNKFLNFLSTTNDT